MALFEQQALDMGASTKFSAQEAADAQSFLAMAGLSVQQSLAALPGTLQLAAAGQMDLARAADITTNVMSGYRLAVGDIPRINDVLAATAASANTNVEQMGDAMSYVAPVAAAAGVKFEETSAALGILASNAMAGERGGTALRGIFATLMSPTEKLASLTEKYGVTLYNAQGEMQPFEATLRQLSKGGIEAGEVMDLFGKRAGPAMLALLATGGDALKDYTGDLEAAEGAAQRMADTQQEGIVGSFTRATSAVSTLAITIGKELSPVASAMADLLASTAGNLIELINHSSTFKAVLVGVATVGLTVVIAKVGLLVLAMGKLAIATTIATGGVNLILPAIVTGIGLAAAAMWTFRGAVADALASAIDLYSDFFIAILTQVNKVATITDKLFGTDFAVGIAEMASNIEQFRTDTGESLRGYSQSQKDAEAATIATAKALEVLDGIRAVDTLWELSEHAMALAESGGASSEAMEGVAQQAMLLKREGDVLDDTLQNIVNAYGDSTAAADAMAAAEREAAAEATAAQQAIADEEAAVIALSEALAASSQELNDFRDRQADFRSEAATTTAWLQTQHDDRVAAALAADSAELNDFRDMQVEFRSTAADTTAWLADQALARGTESGTAFLNGISTTFAQAFAGGGGFLGGLQSVMTQGWGSLFLAEGEEQAGGFLGTMQGVFFYTWRNSARRSAAVSVRASSDIWYWKFGRSRMGRHSETFRWAKRRRTCRARTFRRFP